MKGHKRNIQAHFTILVKTHKMQTRSVIEIVPIIQNLLLMENDLDFGYKTSQLSNPVSKKDVMSVNTAA